MSMALISAFRRCEERLVKCVQSDGMFPWVSMSQNQQIEYICNDLLDTIVVHSGTAWDGASCRRKEKAASSARPRMHAAYDHVLATSQE